MALGRPALVLLALGLVARLLVVALHPVAPVSDFELYHRHAATLVEHGVYGGEPRAPNAYWAPGWPLVLAAAYLPLGVHAQLGAFLGVVLEWGAIVLAAVAASRLLQPAFATGAVAAMCFYPGALAYAPVLGSEHLAALLFTGVVVLMAFARPTPGAALLAGLLDGALLLARGEFGFVTLVVTAVWLVRAIPARRLPGLAALTIVGALICIGPWTARNAITFGEFIPAATNGGLTFYHGTLAPEYTGSRLSQREGATSTTHPGAHDRFYWRRGSERVRDDPLRWLAFDVRRIYHQYGEEKELLRWGEVRSRVLRALAYAYWLAIAALALAGLVTLFARRRRLPAAWCTIAGSILGVSVLKLAFVVNERDRLPLTYLLIVVAGLGAQTLAESRANRPNRTAFEPRSS